MIRQGDVLFVPVTDTDPTRFANMTPRDNGIIQQGEATGHHHRVAVLDDARVWEEGWRKAIAYVETFENGATIVHEEHGPVQLAPHTTYRVHIAREFDYLAGIGRRVRD